MVKSKLTKQNHNKNQQNRLSLVLLRTYNPYIFIITIGFILYFQTLFFDYTHADDIYLIKENYSILKDIRNLPKLFLEDVFIGQDLEVFYRPLLNVSFMFDAILGGESLYVYHFTNIILHLTASCLIFVLLKKFFGNKISVLWTTLFFVVHPIQLQTVAWIPGRNDSLLAVFVLISFLAYLNYLENPNFKKYILHLLFFAISLLTKETGIGLIILILFFLLVKLRKEIFYKKNLYVYLGWIFVTIPWFIIRESLLTKSKFENFLAIAGSYFQNISAFLLYIGKILLPFNLNTYPTLPDSNLIYGVISIVILAIMIIKAKKPSGQNLMFGAGWFIIFLSFALVRSSEIIVPEFSEHRAYIPLIGFLIIFNSLSFPDVFKQYNKFIQLFSVLILISLAVMNFVYAKTYKDGFSYWSRAVQNSPNSGTPYQALGDLHYKQGNYQLALQFFNTVIQKEAKSYDVYIDIGVILDKMDKLEEAERSYRKVLELNPNNKKAIQNLAVNLDKQGRVEEAENIFKKAIEVDPDFAETYNNLGIHYSKRGMLKNAEDAFKKALVLNTNYGSAHYNLSILYYTLGNFDLAIKHFKEAERLGAPISDEIRKIFNQFNR